MHKFFLLCSSEFEFIAMTWNFITTLSYSAFSLYCELWRKYCPKNRQCLRGKNGGILSFVNNAWCKLQQAMKKCILCWHWLGNHLECTLVRSKIMSCRNASDADFSPFLGTVCFVRSEMYRRYEMITSASR